MFVLAILHTLIIALTNVLVQYPFTMLGFHSTWGIVSYPLIFMMTDLTVRLLGAKVARKTILMAMFPGLILSYFMANFSQHHDIQAFYSWNALAFRVAFASFTAYLLGQWLDIRVFQGLRKIPRWWVAPTLSSLLGNIIDTFCFFFLAFYHSSNPFFADHWVEIALVDLVFKLIVSLLSCLPLYWLILNYFRPVPHFLQKA